MIRIYSFLFLFATQDKWTLCTLIYILQVKIKKKHHKMTRQIERNMPGKIQRLLKIWISKTTHVNKQRCQTTTYLLHSNLYRASILRNHWTIQDQIRLSCIKLWNRSYRFSSTKCNKNQNKRNDNHLFLVNWINGYA